MLTPSSLPNLLASSHPKTIIKVLFEMQIQMQLTLSERKRLKELLKSFKTDWKISKRLEAVRLLSEGLSVDNIAKQLAVRKELIYEYFRTFRKGGLNALLNMQKPGKETKLTEEMLRSLEEYIAKERIEGRNHSYKSLVDWILEKYNISLSPQWLSIRLYTRRKLLKDEPWR